MESNDPAKMKAALENLQKVGAELYQQAQAAQAAAGAQPGADQAASPGGETPEPKKAQKVEGKVVEGFRGLDVGEKVAVKLVGTNVERGFLDFVRIGCMKQLYCHFAGPKEWTEFEGGPHLLLHWQHGDAVLKHAIAWMERRIDAPGNSP